MCTKPTILARNYLPEAGYRPSSRDQLLELAGDCRRFHHFRSRASANIPTVSPPRRTRPFSVPAPSSAGLALTIQAITSLSRASTLARCCRVRLTMQIFEQCLVLSHHILLLCDSSS